MTSTRHNQKLSKLHNRISQIRQEAASLKQNLEKLRAGADLYSDLPGDQQVCAYRMAPDGTIVAASPALMRMLGYENLDELRAKNPDGDEYDADYVQAIFARHRGQVRDIKSAWRRKDGTIVHVRESASAMYDDQGRPIEYDGIIEEIVEPEQAEAPRTQDVSTAADVPQPGADILIIEERDEGEQEELEHPPAPLEPSAGSSTLIEERDEGEQEELEHPPAPPEADGSPQLGNVSEANQPIGLTSIEPFSLTPLTPVAAATPPLPTGERGLGGEGQPSRQLNLSAGSNSTVTPPVELADAAPELPLASATIVEPPSNELPSMVDQPLIEPFSLTPSRPEGTRATPPLLPQRERGLGGEGQRSRSSAPAGVVAPPPLAPAGAGLNTVLNRGSAVQRAVERLRGQVNTESAGDDSRSLLGGSMELREYWKIIWKRLWLIVLLMLIGGSATGYYAYQQPPQYRSTTTLYLNPAAASTLVSYQPYDSLDSLARTYTEFLKTRSFASHVAEKVTLNTGTIIGALSTEYVANTQFYRITATYTDPQVTQSLANIAAQVLIDQNIARQQAQQEQIKSQGNPDPERERLVDVRTALQNELDLYNSQLTTVQAKLDELQRQPQSEANDKQILSYQSQLATLHASRLSAINGLANTQAALATTEATVAPNLDTAVVVDAAPLPGGPLPDTTVQSILIALLTAMSIGAALAFLLEYMDYTIKTPEAMEAIYGTATQGAIGLAGGKRVQDRSPSQLVTVTDSLSPIAESFRALRTGVGVAGLLSQMRSLMITSARPGEGKTFVAANLAVSMAQNGSRVILVDADLRKPSLHYVFDLPLDPGFTNLVLDQDSAIEDFLRPTSVANLRVLTCGIVPPNPAELLGSPRAAAVMELLAEHADIVVYDSPPAATVVDAVVIGPRMDAVLHVIHAGKTRIDLVRRCKALLERGGAHILGPVLNQVSLPELRSYSYYYTYDYKQAGRRQRAKRPKGAPNSAKVSTNGSTVHSK